MSEKIRISKTDLDSLKGILEVVSSAYSDSSNFRLLYIEAQAKDDFLLKNYKVDMLQLEELVLNSENGLKLTLEEGKMVVSNLVAVKDLLIVLPKVGEESFVSRKDEFQELMQKCSVVIDLFDSSYIDVYSE